VPGAPHPLVQGAGTPACGRGVGGVPIPTRGHTLWYSVYLSTLCCAGSVKLNFFAELRSVSSFGIGSSAELGMPRNEHFLPRNNGILSESIPRNFFGTKFRSQPYGGLIYICTLYPLLSVPSDVLGVVMGASVIDEQNLPGLTLLISENRKIKKPFQFLIAKKLNEQYQNVQRRRLRTKYSMLPLTFIIFIITKHIFLVILRWQKRKL
jgi:hypothetical protein